jgi:hypothetical protein
VLLPKLFEKTTVRLHGRLEAGVSEQGDWNFDLGELAYQAQLRMTALRLTSRPHRLRSSDLDLERLFGVAAAPAGAGPETGRVVLT